LFTSKKKICRRKRRHSTEYKGRVIKRKKNPTLLRENRKSSGQKKTIELCRIRESLFPFCFRVGRGKWENDGPARHINFQSFTARELFEKAPREWKGGEGERSDRKAGAYPSLPIGDAIPSGGGPRKAPEREEGDEMGHRTDTVQSKDYRIR